MKAIKLWYWRDPYISHQRVASTYKRLLGRRFVFADSLEDADIVFLHVEPHDYESLYQRYPLLRAKYVISYCVWEASHLPDSYVRSLNLVHEIWTCSRYCVQVISQSHRNVTLIPHVVEREMSCDATDAYAIKRAIGFSSSNFYFLAIGRTFGSRKNMSWLADVFLAASKAMPEARLIIKTPPNDPATLPQDERIVYLPFHLSDSQINALYRCAGAVVSAHHAEGWGLTLSDALLFKKPVIATGYSGNLEFMNVNNSFLIASSEQNIHEADACGLYTEEMKWAYPERDSLAESLLTVFHDYDGGDILCKTAQGERDCEPFALDVVAEKVYDRMEDIIDSI